MRSNEGGVMVDVRVVGPRDGMRRSRDATPVDATSRASNDWQRELSPFHLGPCPLYGGRVARRMENAWQFAKLYAAHADDAGEPTDAYWRWAEGGWSDGFAHRFPMGKGARPLCSLWEGRRLDYGAARREVYWPLYRDAVRRTAGFARLVELAARGPVEIFDFDGYADASVAQALADLSRPMGHAFVLKAMLERGVDASPEGYA